MNRKLAFMTKALSIFGAFLLGAWAQSERPDMDWPDSLEALTAAPRNHKVLYEDDHIRLLEVTIQSGETENMHGHRWPSVFAYDAVVPAGTNNFLNGKVDHYPRDYENDDWSVPKCGISPYALPHRMTITDPFPAHFYNLEFKRIDGKSIMESESYPR